VSRRLLRARHAAGYRPIAIDRPGFGLTDEIEGLTAGAHDPFSAAARDAVLVLDHLKIHQTDLVSRGAAQFALAFERAAPGRLRRAVLVNPDPHSLEARRRAGRTAAGKELFRRNPAVIRFLARILIRGVTYDHVAEELGRSVQGSPADERAIREPEVVRDYFHALRTFATGRIEGFINEQTYFATAGWPEALRGAGDWRVLVGGDDFMHDPERVAAYWRIVLPDTPVSVVPGSGRFLAISQPELVVGALVG
jgi:pimeloyl-ACP methyl ester carboxylesterase